MTCVRSPTSGFSASRSLPKPCGRSLASAARELVDRRDHAGAPEQRAFGRRVDDNVGDQPGKKHVVGADRQQHQIELAICLTALGLGHGLA